MRWYDKTGGQAWMLDEQKIKRLRPVIDRVFSFVDAAEAFRYVASHGQFGRIMISMDE